MIHLVGFSGIVGIIWERRLPEIDKVQIMRWRAFGPRHKGAIIKNCMKNDFSCRPRQRLLQWDIILFFNYCYTHTWQSDGHKKSLCKKKGPIGGRNRPLDKGVEI